MFKNAIQLYEPIHTYKPLAENIGIVDGPLVYMSYPGVPFVSVPFPTRMTVVKLASGELWLHSPTAFNAALAKQLEAMGKVAHFVSPNLLHYAHIAEWARAFPNATTWASPGVRERARSRHIDVHFQKDLGGEAPAEWRNDLMQVVIPGAFLSELVFFHKASKTLILTDTIENFELDKIRQPYRFLVWASRSYAPDHGQMPIDLRSTFLSKRAEARPAVEAMISWRPERIIVSHGACINADAEKALRFAFRWAL
ncbi:MAG: DUF4336 domain-containing protein [Patescibacteria group bacterium]|nr:DUF4336 domain-containing protein [Patescibacteria group bacterium]